VLRVKSRTFLSLCSSCLSFNSLCLFAYVLFSFYSVIMLFSSRISTWFLTISWKYNLHTINSPFAPCIIRWVSVYSQHCARILLSPQNQLCSH
jgi:hypothetical protein